MSSQFQQLLSGIDRIANALESLAAAKGGDPEDEKRFELAAVAIKNGATSFAAIARELGIHPSTASRSPGIRRAKKMAIVDRSVGKEESEDFWRTQFT